MDEPLTIELNELSSLICNFSKGLCAESQVTGLLERIRQRVHLVYGFKAPNNISTQIIALEKELASILSKKRLPKFQLRTKIPISTSNKPRPTTLNDGFKPKKCVISTNEITITSQINEQFLIPTGQATSALVTLEHLYNCDVEILDIVVTVYIKKLDNCNILVGPCTGSIMIHESRNCTFKLTCKQLRIHDSNNIKCLVNTSIAPIIENCTGIGYNTNNFIYEGYLKQLKSVGLNELVDAGKQVITDFCWQKNTPSPNWYYL